MIMLKSFVLAITCVVSPLLAQDDPWRRSNLFWNGRVLGPYVGPNHTGNNSKLEWTVSLEISVKAELPLQRIGGGYTISEKRMLFSGGRLDGSGVICVVDLVLGAKNKISITEVQAYPGMDLLSITWDGDWICALDLTGTRLVVGPWGGTGSLPLPSQMRTLATSATVPALSHPVSLGVSRRDDPKSQFESPGFILGRDVRHRTSWIAEFARQSGAWASLPAPPKKPLNRSYSVLSNAVVPTTGPIQLQGPISSYVLRDLTTGVDVLSGTITDPFAIYTHVLSKELELGHSYQLIGTNVKKRSGKFYPTVRYGRETEAQDVSTSKGMVNTRVTRIGGTLSINYQLSAIWLKDDLVLPGVAIYSAFRDPVTGEDPVIEVPPLALLQNPVLRMSGNLTIRDGYYQESVSLRLPIPSDPKLVGRVILFQLAALAPNGIDLILSDVCGAKIHDVEQPAEVSAPQTLASGSKSKAFELGIAGTSGTLDPGQLKLHKLYLDAVREASMNR